VQHHNIVFHQLLKHVPWPTLEALVAEHNAEPDPRGLTCKAQLIAMLYAQFSGAQSLREIDAALKSHGSKLYHLGGCAVSRSALATANASRPAAVFHGVLEALIAQLARGARRKLRDCVRLVDSTSVRLSGLSGWAGFSAEVFGAKAHIVYDPHADQPVYLAVTPARVNDITVAQAMPIEPGATYVFDLGYYDFAWWAKLDRAGCTIVTRLKKNTRLTLVEERPLAAGSPVLSDRLGHLPERLAGSRHNPMDGLVREVRVRHETGKVLRLFTNDLEASAEEIGALYVQRWAIELFFRWVKQTLEIGHFFGTSENAVRIQITIALIAFMLLRLAHDANQIVASRLGFTRLIRANLMHRRPVAALRGPEPPPQPDQRQARFDFKPRAANGHDVTKRCTAPNAAT